MNTTQKIHYRKVTLTLPESVAADLSTIPKGERSAFASELFEKELKFKKFKEALEEIQKGPPIKIKLYPGGWRKCVPIFKKK